MAEEKENLTNSNQEKQDITKLRQAVLKWIDNEKPVGPRPVQTVVTPPENEKTAIPKDILNIRINKKNKPAENFLEECGFILNKDENEERDYILNVGNEKRNNSYVEVL